MSTRVCGPLNMTSANLTFGAGLRGIGSLRRNSDPTPTSAAVSGSARVKRCLFGPPDPRSGQFAREKLRELMEEEKRKWEFDFDQERPLPNATRFMWEPVQVASAASSTSSTHLPSGSSSRSWISGEEGLLIVRGRQASSPTPERSPTPVRGMMEERIEESHVNVNNHPGLPSPPSSLEESSAPSSPSGQEEEKEPKSKVVKSSKPKKITDFLLPRKRRAATASSSSSTSCSPPPPPEKKPAL